MAKPSTSKEIGSSPRQNREFAQLQEFNSEIQFNIAQSEDVLQSTPENEHRYHYHLTTVEEDDSEIVGPPNIVVCICGEIVGNNGDKACRELKENGEEC